MGDPCYCNGGRPCYYCSTAVNDERENDPRIIVPVGELDTFLYDDG